MNGDGIPRMHVNRHGDPKPRLSEVDAFVHALMLNLERQADPRRRDRGLVTHYRCAYCATWHVGTRRAALRHPTLRVEVGERVWWNLTAENRGSRESRLRAIGFRLRRRGREAIPSHVAA